ncbi:hypothetical protein [Paraburkholderia sp. BL25I1N1]|uniref:hypothetical protein n=1 Tax=Paraburkholderia sp. BL25I1N1 TaxID=1938804 RepID=UPI000D04EAD9|nr:hypothetical protein [Paraburkholderia sp. BL25I1N1]PRX92081.1 hypothetical protein B0G73_13643 [Paraburkholderia sp. BL25I1N1]
MYDMRLDPQGNLLPGKTWDDSPGLPPAEAEMVLSMLDVPIAIDRCFVEVCGDLAAAAMLTELSTVESETGRHHDWLQVAPDEFARRLALTESQQRAARRLLRSKGLIAHRRCKTLPADEFRILWPAVLALLQRKADERTAHIVWPPVRPDQPQQLNQPEEVHS